MLIGFVVVAVAVAFADSSIVVLALPELYGRFDTTIEGVSWVITAYNASVALVALALVLVVDRWRAAYVLAGGLATFIVASIACASYSESVRSPLRSRRFEVASILALASGTSFTQTAIFIG